MQHTKPINDDSHLIQITQANNDLCQARKEGLAGCLVVLAGAAAVHAIAPHVTQDPSTLQNIDIYSCVPIAVAGVAYLAPVIERARAANSRIQELITVYLGL